MTDLLKAFIAGGLITAIANIIGKMYDGIYQRKANDNTLKKLELERETAENTEQRSMREELRKQIDWLDTQNRTLKTEKATLEAEKATLTTENRRLVEENAQLKQKQSHQTHRR